MANDLFRRNRPFYLFNGFYTEWSEHLTKHCLPLFRQFQPSAVNNAAVLRDLISYYDTIDHYANRATIFYFLFPSWHVNSFETSILFLGDIHPYLFTSLVESFIESDLAAWEDQSLGMKIHMSLIKEDINIIVFRLLHDMKETQEGFMKSFTDNWVSSFHYQRLRQSVTVMETAGSVTLDAKFVRIFREANQLRKNTITDIVNVSDVNQAALFLEGVCEFFAGFTQQFRPNQQFPPHYQQMMQQQQPYAPYQPMMQQQQPYAPYQPMMQQQPYAPYQPMRQQQQQRPYAPFRAQVPPRNYNVRPMTQHQPEQFHEIYVRDLDLGVTHDMLRQSFSRYPSVREVNINDDPGGNQKHGLVSFADESERRRAMQEMNGAMLLDKPMKINLAD